MNGNMELFHFPGGQKRIRSKEPSVFLDLAGGDNGLVVIV
jgi:hypothetical protein